MSGKFKRYCLFVAAGIGWFLLGITALGADVVPIDSEIIKTLFGEAASNQIAQAGFFFLIASWIHSGRVKKEIKLNFAGLTEAINNVADSLKKDLKSHSEILGKQAGSIDNLSLRVQYIENNLKIKEN